MVKANSILRVLFSMLAVVILVSGCGSKEDSTTKTESKDKDTKTTSSDTKNTSETKTTSGKQKKEIKKSDAPKKDISEKAPEDWTALQSNDGKLQFSLPSQWTVEENSATRLVTLSEDKTMGVSSVVFADDEISSEDLLEKALSDFDFEPEGEANEVAIGSVEGYLTVARGNINGTDMMMYIMSAIEPEGKGNYVVYVYTPTEAFEKNSTTMEKILYSINFN